MEKNVRSDTKLVIFKNNVLTLVLLLYLVLISLYVFRVLIYILTSLFLFVLNRFILPFDSTNGISDLRKGVGDVENMPLFSIWNYSLFTGPKQRRKIITIIYGRMCNLM